MFPPFEEQKAASILKSVLRGIYAGKIYLVRSARLSDNRETSSVMLGAMICTVEGKTENLITLSGISCALKGNLPGIFVEPAVSSIEIEDALSKNDKEIHELTDIINLEEKKAAEERFTDKSKAQLASLKRLRTSLCDESLSMVFERYSFACFDGKKRKMTDLIRQKTHSTKLPPTGTGDCCAPKLLNYAFGHGLTPVSMAETKIHFTLDSSACAARPRPLLGEITLVPPCNARCSLVLPGILGLEIIYRDSDIIVVNKPSGLLSVPGRGEDKQDCVVRRVKRLFPSCIEQPSVHRLDMETSGLMVLAFTKEAHRELNRQFENREVDKKYTALLDGVLAKKGIAQRGTMELYFRVDIENRPHQIWDSLHGKKAVTEWNIENVEYYTAPNTSRRPVTRVCFVPHTGRTHQLRLAAADKHGFGIPIIGDTLYGHCAEGERLMLHANYLRFTHPRTGKKMEFKSEPPF